MDSDELSLREVNDRLARQVVESCSQRGLTVSTAESLTAGLIAATIGNIPGASAVLKGGAVTYCDEIKHHVLGVSRETLETQTAVSYACAREMASGARELYGTDIAVSATGYAGPGGGTAKDPAGTFYIGCEGDTAIFGDMAAVSSERFWHLGDRTLVRLHAVHDALRSVLGLIDLME